jgi:Family of unknown function (DUF695)/Regulator of ribonuclease activity B/Domain of unknown function (DUF4034)
MEDRWETYPCTLDDHPSFITFNLGFAHRAAEPHHPHLAGFRLQLSSPDERGLPQGDELAQLNQLEDLLCERITPDQGVQVGRVTGAGRRDLAFYVSLSDDECFALMDEVTAHTGYGLALMHREDPRRDHYWQLLYPTPADWQRIHNRRVEAQLRDQGDPLTEARDIDHCALFPSASTREAFTMLLSDDFQVVSQHEATDRDTERFVIAFKHHGLPDQVSMHAPTLQLVALAEAQGGRYDGWGSPVLADETPPSAYLVDDLPERMASHLQQWLDDGEHELVEEDLAYSPGEDIERKVYGLATLDGAVERAARWVHARPDHALARVALGASMIVQGWKVRGTGYADQVAEEAWAPFLASLDSACTPLLQAAELDPDSAEPHAWLILADMAGRGGPEAIHQHFVNATRRVPNHWAAHFKYMTSLTQKWGGSHEQMFAFALAKTALAAPGDLLHVLLPMAINEFELAEGPQGRLALRAHAPALKRALYQWLEASPDTLAERLTMQSSSFWHTGLNHFATACYLCGAHDEARAVIAALCNEIESVPWLWLAQNTWERKQVGRVHDRVKAELGGKGD